MADTMADEVRLRMFPGVPADVVILLPIPPSTNNLFFNAVGRHGGRCRTPEYQDWCKVAGWELKRQRPAPVPGMVSLLIEVAEPETKRRQDVTNRIKAVEDLLVIHGIIQGDDQRFVREVTARWAPIEGVRVIIRQCK